MHNDKPVLGLFASAAGGTENIRERLVAPLVQRGWAVTITLTPTAWTWLKAAGELGPLEELTGYPVRCAPRLPGEVSPHPDPDCIAAIPASANTIAKMALGIGDNQVLTHLCEALGQDRIPVVVFPHMSLWNVRHPIWKQHIATLEASGAKVLYGEDIWEWLAPGERVRDLPWAVLIAAIEEAVAVGPKRAYLPEAH
jgi:hypothetical protein